MSWFNAELWSFSVAGGMKGVVLNFSALDNTCIMTGEKTVNVVEQKDFHILMVQG
jgi:hypothetical protein